MINNCNLRVKFLIYTVSFLQQIQICRKTQHTDQSRKTSCFVVCYISTCNNERLQYNIKASDNMFKSQSLTLEEKWGGGVFFS